MRIGSRTNERKLHLPRRHEDSAEAEDGHEAETSVQLLRFAHAIHVGAIVGIALLLAVAILDLVCEDSIAVRVVCLGRHDGWQAQPGRPWRLS